MAFSAPERETVIVFNDIDAVASVYTAQRRVITQLKKNRAATLVDDGVFEGSPWARFELPKRFVSFRSKIRTFDEDERTRRGAQLRRANQMRAALEISDSNRDN
jgi:hypothetical protein